ncbi:hypothetical protein [Paracoccus marcusii]|uniref:hypothetical protein n=1 Tax=Paracoccus marcusii TaxID=59779 RepID=UPI0032646233
MISVPKKQGHLDGLCGIYAIVNALTELGESRPELLFATACQSLSPSRWPETLWEGTTLRDLEVMIKSCIEELNLDGISVKYPFRSTQPTSDTAFWTRFEELFSDNGSNKCAIVGLEEPSLHWLVVKPSSGNMLFIDSDGLTTKSKVSRQEIYAGQRRSNGQKYRLNRKEVILFERIE